MGKIVKTTVGGLKKMVNEAMAPRPLLDVKGRARKLLGVKGVQHIERAISQLTKARGKKCTGYVDFKSSVGFDSDITITVTEQTGPDVTWDQEIILSVNAYRRGSDFSNGIVSHADLAAMTAEALQKFDAAIAELSASPAVTEAIGMRPSKRPKLAASPAAKPKSTPSKRVKSGLKPNSNFGIDVLKKELPDAYTDWIDICESTDYEESTPEELAESSYFEIDAQGRLFGDGAKEYTRFVWDPVGDLVDSPSTGNGWLSLDDDIESDEMLDSIQPVTR